MTEKFDPYYKWLGIPPKDQPPHHYRLLGIELFEQDRDVIDAAANRVMSYLKDLATGDEAAHSQALLNEISRARICLLNAAKKSAYDDQLREKLKADRNLEEARLKPPAKRAPPKSKSAGPPPAKPPAAVPPPSGTTAPPAGTPGGFPALNVPAQKRPANQPINIVIQTEDKQKDRAAERKEDPVAVDEGKEQDKHPHRRFAILAGLLLASVVVFLIALIFFGGSQEPSPKPVPQASGTGTTPELPVLILDLPGSEADALTAFLLNDEPQELPPQGEIALSEGTHRIVLRRDGFHEISETLTLVNGQRRNFTTNWKPIDAPSPDPAPTTSVPILPGLPTSFESTAVNGLTGGFGRMVGHWAFDDDEEDDSGNQKHGTLVGDPAFVEGRLGRALQLNGGQRFEVHSRLFADSSEFSVAFWIRLGTMPGDAATILNGGGWAVYLQAGRPTLRIQQSEPVDEQGSGTQPNGFNGIDLSQHLDNWTHLAIVYSAPARQAHYYVNGEHQGHHKYSDRTPAEMSQLIVSSLVGPLDDLRVFDYRLSNTDVETLYEGRFQPLLSAPDKPNGRLVCETWYDVPPDLNRQQIERITVQQADEKTVVRNWLIGRKPRGNSPFLLNRIRGFLYPPESGEYVFRLRSSGGAMLYIQRFGSDEDSLTRIIFSEPLGPSSSQPISLEANKAYYFELVEQCDSTTKRTIRVGWQKAENPLPRPIPITCLSSYGESE